MPAEKIPSWIERILLPRLSEISGEIKEVRGELKAINTRIDSTNERMINLENKMDTKIDSLRNASGISIPALDYNSNGYQSSEKLINC